jgi:opacity protein-like surface antigen
MLKKLLVSSVAAVMVVVAAPAVAADAPIYTAPPVYAPWSWTGFYLGLHWGGGWGTKGWSDPTNFFAGAGFFPGSGPIGGLLAGGQAGFNYQVGSIVWGAEVDFSLANLDGNTNCGGTAAGGGWICHARVNGLGTLAGRLGYAFDHSLLYLKAGGAWANEKHDVSSFFFLNNFAGSETRWGWTLGAGFEHALTPHWSVKAEYNYLGFGTDRVNLPDQFGNNPPFDISQHIHVFKMGLNYKFGPDPDAWPATGYARMPVKAPVRVASDWVTDIGTRYWYSSGRFQKVLFDPFVTTQMNSRLTYSNLTASTLEGFTRIEHMSGVFVKGYFGIGDLTSGHLNDEDFPPALVPYSNTLSAQKNGRLLYASADIGYDFWMTPVAKAGAFVGYHYYNQRENAVGCNQIAGNPAVCFPGQVPAGQLTITETEHWNSLRVGLAGEFMLTPQLKISGDAAYLPYVRFNGSDNHWLRPNINPLPEQGHGTGVQLEAILSYLVTNQFTIGVGGRYWYMRAPSGTTQFPGGFPPSPETFRTERYGAFAQAAYKFASGQ